MAIRYFKSRDFLGENHKLFTWPFGRSFPTAIGNFCRSAEPKPLTLAEQQPYRATCAYANILELCKVLLCDFFTCSSLCGQPTDTYRIGLKQSFQFSPRLKLIDILPSPVGTEQLLAAGRVGIRGKGPFVTRESASITYMAGNVSIAGIADHFLL